MKNTPGYLLLLLFALFGACQAKAQNSNSIYSDKTGAARYSDIDGSPYLYKNWLDAEVIASSGRVYTQTKTNYNGYTQTIEYYEGEEVKEMLTGSYLKVSFQTEDGVQAFIRGMHAEFGMDLVCLLYDGENIDFTKKVVVNVQEYNTPNATISKFIPSVDYFFIKNGKLIKLPLKKKKILDALKDKSNALEKYIEEHDLKLKNEGEVIELLGYYEGSLN